MALLLLLKLFLNGTFGHIQEEGCDIIFSNKQTITTSCCYVENNFKVVKNWVTRKMIAVFQIGDYSD